MMRFVIAGGGTGGHLFPALAVGEVLNERGHEVLVFISEKEVDALATRDRSDFRFEKIPGIGMPKILSPAFPAFLWRFSRSLGLCGKIYSEFQPDVVLGMGGFTSTAPILAGRMRKVPTFVHESNAIPGKANKLNARLADTVLLGLEECSRYFSPGKSHVTGTPVRRTLKVIPREEALSVFGLSPGKKTLLVMGGSQGARGINECVSTAMTLLADLDLQLIHLTGKADEARIREFYESQGVYAYVSAFCHQMEHAYSAADVAIARSGAASLAEMAFFGIPSVLIPYPYAAEDHQTLNAEVFARANAAVLLHEKDATGETLGEKLHEILSDTSQLRAMSEQARKLAPVDAAKRVADIVELRAKSRKR
jgi:UDP-N-acetylglucosamine--N-acetylmuramyl-(pentapeptide) pyrophosphoryl-undecaprenol N-acetylglucosamine transferase